MISRRMEQSTRKKLWRAEERDADDSSRMALGETIPSITRAHFSKAAGAEGSLKPRRSWQFTTLVSVAESIFPLEASRDSDRRKMPDTPLVRRHRQASGF
jgi:hypothetical protein